MDNNIFEGAVWGQKFRTRNDREAVFYEHVVDSHGCDVFVCRVRGEINDSLHNADGTCSYSHELDIVSRYQEPIDNKKGLFDIVENVVDYCRRFGITDTTASQCYESLFSDVTDK